MCKEEKLDLERGQFELDKAIFQLERKTADFEKIVAKRIASDAKMIDEDGSKSVEPSINFNLIGFKSFLLKYRFSLLLAKPIVFIAINAEESFLCISNNAKFLNVKIK